MGIADFIGAVARPVAIIVTSVCGGAAMVIGALRIENGNDGAIYIGAAAVIVTGIYASKAVEETFKAVKGK